MAPCIVIPAYNAERTVVRVVTEVCSLGYRVLVVDDGSIDRTAVLLADLPVTLLCHGSNRGKGAALKTGFRWALDQRCSGVVTLDADGQHEVTAIPQLIAAAGQHDLAILIASRYAQFQQMAGLRRHWNRFGAWCIKTRTGFNIDDSQSGFRYYSADLLRSLTLDRNGYDLEMELLVKGWRAGFRIDSIPVAARVADGRATSHFRPVQDTWHICMTFLRYM
ncbi:glycosyltransferase family 2 protein [Geobacter argillaceus]|uniref:Glycosyl transferase family 2 n=1 Tax=Geobacter argillaceus TaxID=345631 RepID=A0A562VM87_9BACT|nr:glycosyltransferase family 2 protein [Geobacter argillaceus]TWJ19010.1 glycosyl transferase family 2 [Geobacter argillaceus]